MALFLISQALFFLSTAFWLHGVSKLMLLPLKMMMMRLKKKEKKKKESTSSHKNRPICAYLRPLNCALYSPEEQLWPHLDPVFQQTSQTSQL